MESMNDLRALNERILLQTQAVNVNLHHTLDVLSVCVGKLSLSSTQLAAALQSLPGCTHENSLDVTSINKDYLLYARQTSRDILHGYYAGLIILGIDLAQAKIIAQLSNQQITELSRRWDGTVFEVTSAATRKVVRFHASAAPHYSVAMLAAAA